MLQRNVHELVFFQLLDMLPNMIQKNLYKHLSFSLLQHLLPLMLHELYVIPVEGILRNEEKF
jgi:hypothetical protein